MVVRIYYEFTNRRFVQSHSLPIPVARRYTSVFACGLYNILYILIGIYTRIRLWNWVWNDRHARGKRVCGCACVMYKGGGDSDRKHTVYASIVYWFTGAEGATIIIQCWLSCKRQAHVAIRACTCVTAAASEKSFYSYRNVL